VTAPVLSSAEACEALLPVVVFARGASAFDVVDAEDRIRERIRHAVFFAGQVRRRATSTVLANVPLTTKPAINTLAASIGPRAETLAIFWL